jgi:hypothetical protein
MLKKTLFCLFLVSAFISAASAQSVYTPAKGSAERTEILNALRAPVEKELRQKIQFVIEHFNVSGSWAFVSGEPQNAAGGRPDYRGTKYQSAIDNDMFDNNFFALLKKNGRKWKVVTRAIGCTDVCYATWWRNYKAPKAIFPYTE